MYVFQYKWHPSGIGLCGWCEFIGDDIRTIEINADVILNASKDIGLQVNTGKTKYMEIWRYWGTMANEHIRIDSDLYEKNEKL